MQTEIDNQKVINNGETKTVNKRENPLLVLNASRSPEERKLAAQKAGLASAAKRKKEKVEALLLQQMPTDFIQAARIAAMGETETGLTLAADAIKSLADIALHSSSESNRIKAMELYTRIAGQQAAIEVRVGNTDDKPFSTIDLGSLSKDELIKLRDKYRPKDEDVIDI